MLKPIKVEFNLDSSWCHFSQTRCLLTWSTTKAILLLDIWILGYGWILYGNLPQNVLFIVPAALLPSKSPSPISSKHNGSCWEAFRPDYLCPPLLKGDLLNRCPCWKGIRSKYIMVFVECCSRWQEVVQVTKRQRVAFTVWSSRGGCDNHRRLWHAAINTSCSFKSCWWSELKGWYYFDIMEQEEDWEENEKNSCGGKVASIEGALNLRDCRVPERPPAAVSCSAVVYSVRLCNVLLCSSLLLCTVSDWAFRCVQCAALCCLQMCSAVLQSSLLDYSVLPAGMPCSQQLTWQNQYLEEFTFAALSEFWNCDWVKRT